MISAVAVVAIAILLAGCSSSGDPTASESGTTDLVTSTSPVDSLPVPTITTAASTTLTSTSGPSTSVDGATTTSTSLPDIGTTPTSAPDSDSTTSTAASSTGPVVADLQVAYGAVGDTALNTAVLRCSATERTGTDYLNGIATEACSRLADPVARELLNPPPTDRACAGVFGGNDQAVVTGTVDGVAVDRTFHRSDGCGIDDWDAMVILLPPLLDSFAIQPDG